MQIAIDIGGTFVDAIALDEGTGQVRFEKVLATRERPWIGVLAAFDALSIELSQVDRFVHGTTMGLNAVLERRGATTGILTNEGFRDIFLIGRGNVPNSEMFHFRWRQPAPIVRRRHTIGAAGRMDASGAVVAELDEAGVRAAADELADAGVESVAICFLHSYRNPAHEQRAAAIIAEHRPELSVSISSDIQREYREFERTSTTVLDAYIRPVIEGYLGRLGDGLENQDFRGRFLVMRSGGGAMTAAQAACSPTQTLLSGPAGGIAGAAQLARALERSSLLTFDMGGTSVDVCVIEDSLPAVSHDAEIERHPLLMPVFDIRTIGAGGGSIAAIEDGLLCVGPHSAGADPGPACYGRGGTSPTVTDAAVCLGYIDAGTFLRGAMPLDVRAAHDALRDGVGVALGLDARDAASRVFEVLLARTVGPVRQLTMERGADPREFSLLAYGGAGPMLGPLVARELGIREVIVPNFPSGFSAWGMLAVDLVDDVAQTDLRLLDELDADDLRRTLAELEQQVCDSLVHQGAERGGLAVQRQLDLRYAG